MDAGSTYIEIFFEDEGLEMFYVKDNGYGISGDALVDCAKRYFTSKIASFEELETLESYGFRGEALHSICSISKQVYVTTKTENDENPTFVTLSNNGEIESSETITANNSKKNVYLTGIKVSGTEVRVCGLFGNFPVRLQVQKSKIKAHLKQV